MCKNTSGYIIKTNVFYLVNCSNVCLGSNFFFLNALSKKQLPQAGNLVGVRDKIFYSFMVLRGKNSDNAELISF